MGFLEYSDNLDEIEDRIMGLADSVDFTKSDLANDIQDIIAEGQTGRHRREVDPSGARWAENAPSTLARKGPLPVGVGITGRMLQEGAVRGDMENDKESFRVKYAGDDFDRAKLGWFEESGRIAWGLDENIKAAVRARIGAEIGDYIHNKGNGGG
jgi:hypothetical protein